MTDFRALCQELIDEIDAKAYGIKSLPSSVAIDRARAALAQPEPQGPTGRPAIEPVPVSERLPGTDDCDADGLCWWWSRDITAWCLCFAADGDSSEWTHWLPYWALPVPGVEGKP